MNNHYAQYALLTLLEANEPTCTLSIEVDPGTFIISASEALEHWEQLAPGESFTIHSVNFHESE